MLECIASDLEKLRMSINGSVKGKVIAIQLDYVFAHKYRVNLEAKCRVSLVLTDYSNFKL